MKVLHIVNTGWFSGAENIACQIIDAFRSNVEMTYCGYDGTIRPVLESSGIEFFPIKKMSVRELKRVLKGVKPDIIHAHDMRASFFASLSCGNIPLVCHVHGNALDSRRISLKSVFFLFAAYKAKHIFWVHESSFMGYIISIHSCNIFTPCKLNPFIKRPCYSFMGYIFHSFFKEKSSILQNVLNTELLIKKKDDDSCNYDYDVVYLGRITSQKNPERLINVFQKLVAINPNAKCAIVGDGIMTDFVAKLIKQMDLTKNVFLLGFKNNPMKLLSDSKALLMTSLWEGLPICALEALALGVPVVSTPVDGLRSIIQNGKNGYLSNNDDEIANYLNILICDKKLHDELSRNCVALSKEYNDFNSYKRKVFSVYNDICA